MGDFIVELDQSIFRAGGTVDGRVKLSLNKPADFYGIYARLSGTARVEYMYPTGDKTKYWRSQDYFDKFITLLGDETNQDVAIPIEAGEHAYEFQFQLPVDLPSSHVDAINKDIVYYDLMVEGRRPGLFSKNYTHNQKLTVIGTPCEADFYRPRIGYAAALGLVEGQEMGVVVAGGCLKCITCCLFCPLCCYFTYCYSSDPFRIQVHVPNAIHEIGQTINCTIEAENLSRHKLKNMRVELCQRFRYECPVPSGKQRWGFMPETLCKQVLDVLPARSTKSWTVELTIPDDELKVLPSWSPSTDVMYTMHEIRVFGEPSFPWTVDDYALAIQPVIICSKANRIDPHPDSSPMVFKY